ncbi:MAG TPA: histidinol-phosphate transaminase [Steroidobacteraceae bacterium]|nr:histidinol-phosphate transaminase [Steroidobacteraceae bacterium]
MSWVTALARPDIQALQPYQHASWEPGLERLHANELPWRAPLDTSEAGLNRYPEPYPRQLASRLAAHYGVGAESVLPCRGSDEAIDLLTRAYCRDGRDAVLVTPPTFGMYSLAARIQGATVIEVPLRRESGFRLEPAAVLAALTPAVKLVYLCSPNNPTGNLLERAALLELARALLGRALLVIDEAYLEFSGTLSLSAELGAHPGLVLLRTLSKAYALAGARCGVLLAHPDIVALLQRVIPPYAITQLTIEIVQRALQADQLLVVRERVAALVGERDRLAIALAALPGVARVWPSAANFLLVDFEDAGAALARARAVGLLLRDLRRAPGLGQSLRISVGTPRQNDRLLESLS